MKKILSLLLSLFLLFSLSAVAFADGEVVEYNWDDVSGNSFWTFQGHNTFWLIEEVNAMMWLPDFFIPFDVSGGELGSDCIGFFAEEDSEAYVLVAYSDLSGITLDSLFSIYSQNGQNVEKVSVNGIPAILERNMENDTLSLTFQTVDNMFLQIVASPASDDNYAMVYNTVFASVQPKIDDEPDAAETVAPAHPVSSLISK